MAKKRHEQAIVVPAKTTNYTVKQPRFEFLEFSGSTRIIVSGKSGSGKSQLVHSMITNFFKGVWTAIYIVARTAFLDGTYISLREHAELHLGQNQKDSPFVFTDPSDPRLLEIFLEHEAKVKKEKAQRTADKSKEPLSGICWIFDDVSDDPQLKIREGLLPKVFTTGRHSCQSVITSVHKLTALSTMVRVNASILCVFKISARIEMEKLTDEYAWLIGRDEFLEMYDIAAGNRAPKYSFLTIMALESDPNRTFYARFDQSLRVEDEEEEEPPEEAPEEAPLTQSASSSSSYAPAQIRQ